MQKLTVFFWLIFLSLSVSSNFVMAADEKIIISAEDDAAPWSQKDGTGYANELVKAIFNAVDKKVELSVVPYARCKANVIAKSVSGCFNMAIQPELKDEVLFSSIPLFTADISYFHNPEHPLTVKEEIQLPKDTKVGTVIGYEYSELFHKLHKEKFLKVEETTSESLNLKKVAMGRIQGTILWHNETKPAEAIIKKSQVEGKVVFAFRSLQIPLHIGFSKDEKGTRVLGLYEKGYELIKKNGVYKKLTDEWIKKAME